MNALTAPGSFGLVPTNMNDAFRLAEMMSSAKLVPKDLQQSTADCLMVVLQAGRWGMDPFAVAQECSVIQGKLMHSGKLVAAVINARGDLADRLSYSYEGSGDDRTITVSGRLQGEADPRVVTVRLRYAKTNNKVWHTQPDQQLMYYGARVWGRRHRPELMLGIYSREEFPEETSERREVQHVAAEPIRQQRIPPTPAPLAIAAPDDHDAETGEVRAPHQIAVEVNGQDKDWILFGHTLIMAIQADPESADKWKALNANPMRDMREEMPRVYDHVVANVGEFEFESAS